MRNQLGWFAVGAVTVIGAVTLGWQHTETMSLETERVPVRAQQADLARLKVENERLRSAQVPAAEVEKLRSGHAAAERLRGEAAALRAQIEAASREPLDGRPVPVRFGAGSTVPAAAWKNAGAGTPLAALESVLCAAAGGDVDAFAELLMIETSKTLPAARALLATLPESMRAHYGTPEKLIAFLAVKDVPLGTATVRRWTNDPADRTAQPLLLLEAPDGRKKEASLLFVRQGESWKLAVLEGVVAKYAAQLKGQAAMAR